MRFGWRNECGRHAASQFATNPALQITCHAEIPSNFAGLAQHQHSNCARAVKVAQTLHSDLSDHPPGRALQRNASKRVGGVCTGMSLFSG
jgi:hypothetical protein